MVGRAVAWLLVLMAVLTLSFSGELAAAAADPDDFVFDAYDATYVLGRDADGRSTLHTTETLVARFPEVDQNRGLQRDLVRVFDGHDTELRVLSVMDEHGAPRAFAIEEAGDFVRVTIAVPEGEFVHGVQTYVLSYAQRDVTGFYSDTGMDEFYWDLNGTGWRQPFARVSARLVLDGEVASAFTGAAVCYRGGFGATAGCGIEIDGSTLTVDETRLGSYENVTIAIAFPGGTFQPRPEPFLIRVPLTLYAAAAALLGALGIAIVARVRNHRGVRTGRAIIAEYEPPERMSVAVAARLTGSMGKATTATLLDLAVRQRIRLLFDEPTGRYGAQLLDREGLQPIEQAFVAKVFAAGDTEWFDQRSKRLGDAAAALQRSATAEARAAGLIRSARKWPALVSVVLLAAALLLTIAHFALVQDAIGMTITIAGGANAFVWVAVILAWVAVAGLPRTEAGALLHDRLRGLKEYIRLAEADRIRMLQSVSGAEVSGERIVQVYERLLPYAALFGMEREWQEALQQYYRETPPAWTADAAANRVRMFSVAGLGAVIAASPATPLRGSGSGHRSSFSSSSGGSSGGGFSGGGGGGGGGRGI